MVGYSDTHHVADMRNLRSFAPLVAGTSSPHLHRLLRTGMRTAMVSSSLNAKHRECPSSNHKCTDIAKSSCCHDQSSASRTSVCPASMLRTFTKASE
jgi:hypothetical protein